MLNHNTHSNITLYIDGERCHICGKCLAKQVCKGRAIHIIDRGEMPFLDSGRCWGCLTCITACPFHAIVRYNPAAHN